MGWVIARVGVGHCEGRAAIGLVRASALQPSSQLLPHPAGWHPCNQENYPSPLPLPQAQADSSGMLLDEQEAFGLADLEASQDARPAPSSGRHTKRRR